MTSAPIEDAPLTAAQTKLASDYCGACAVPLGQTVGACTSAFWGLQLDAGTPPGPGAPRLSYADAIVSKVDSSCTPPHGDGGASACDSFALCAQEATAASLPQPPAACLTLDLDAGSADGG